MTDSLSIHSTGSDDYYYCLLHTELKCLWIWHGARSPDFSPFKY